MRRTSHNVVTALLLVVAMLLFGPGCSLDSALDSAADTQGTTNGSSKFIDNDPSLLAEAGTFIETFDNYSNEGGWSYATNTGYVIENTGGNPDWYLHDDYVQSFIPHPETSLGMQSIFTGNYKERNVVSVGIDLRSFDYDLDISSRYLTLMLMNDAGTPDDVLDDWGAYIIGTVKVPSKYVPMKVLTTANAPGWVSYDFEIPSQSTRLPAGWINWRNSTSGSKPSTGNWKSLMQDVDYVRFYYGDPSLYYIIDTYDLGMDNPRISWE